MYQQELISGLDSQTLHRVNVLDCVIIQRIVGRIVCSHSTK